MIAYERLRTPAQHGGVLLEPSPARLLDLAAAPRSPDAPLLDGTLARLRAGLRQRLALPDAVILTGHQAEFFHAGVLAKRMATSTVAAALGIGEIYLSVDSDTPKSDRLAIAVERDGRLARTRVAIPGCNPALPVEDQPAAPPPAWRAFFDQLASAAGGHELLGVYRDAWLEAFDPRGNLALAFIAGNSAVERQLGLTPALQLCVSSLAETPEFRAFAAHLCLDAGPFRQAYNAAQAEFRRRHHVRNPARPAPPLAARGDRIETPFWVQQPGHPRRRLFVERDARDLVLLADSEAIGREPLADFARTARHERPWTFAAAGWRLRPRALALSGFCRVALCDVFVHGIGGAKYDEMTAHFLEAFFGAPPAALACVTATLRPAERDPAAVRRALARNRWELRDVHYNPQRYTQLPAELSREFAELVAAQQRGDGDRAAVYRGFQQIRQAWSNIADEPARRLRHTRTELERQLASDSAAADREYFYALLPQRELALLAERIRVLITGAAAAPARTVSDSCGCAT